jgi:hypothetical protein
MGDRAFTFGLVSAARTEAIARHMWGSAHTHQNLSTWEKGVIVRQRTYRWLSNRVSDYWRRRETSTPANCANGYSGGQIDLLLLKTLDEPPGAVGAGLCPLQFLSRSQNLMWRDPGDSSWLSESRLERSAAAEKGGCYLSFPSYYISVVGQVDFQNCCLWCH